MPQHFRQLLQLLLFQLGWWACVLSVKFNLELEAIVLCTIVLLIQLKSAPQRTQVLKLIGLVLPIGILLDSMTQWFLGFDFYGWAFQAWSPFWLWMIWAMFTKALCDSALFLGRLQVRYQALLGIIFGPLTYLSGAKLGAAELNASALQLLILALSWGLLTPILIGLTQAVVSKEKT